MPLNVQICDHVQICSCACMFVYMLINVLSRESEHHCSCIHTYMLFCHEFYGFPQKVQAQNLKKNRISS